tara:strand:- start:212 stop:1357 length:1146 start_codon:yes stop_codon:yes gene_type:complete
MEFGKKGDAKKAMKMMWREGITLKQAWKKVKGDKSPRRSRRSRSPKRSKRRASSKRRMSPKKRKAVSNAKKAMRMHHREGITLKQAWKRVNRFGYTVCPEGYAPNPLWMKNEGRGKQCIKACEPGSVRNYVTGRCNKMSGSVVPPGYEPNPNYYIGSNRQPFVKACPPGSIRTASGKCKSIAPSLPLGYEINPETGRRRVACGPNQYRDPNTGKCRNIIAPPGDASLGYMSDDAAYMIFGSKALGMGGKTLGMGGTHRHSYFGSKRVHTPMNVPNLDQSFGGKFSFLAKGGANMAKKYAKAKMKAKAAKMKAKMKANAAKMKEQMKKQAEENEKEQKKMMKELLAFGKNLGSDQRGIMRGTNFGGRRRCSFGTCTACRGGK